MTVLVTAVLVLAVLSGCVMISVAGLLFVEMMTRRSGAAGIIRGAEAMLRASAAGP